MAELADRERPMRETQWHRLGNAVVIRAVQDYRSLRRKRQKQPQNQEIQIELERLEAFFCARQFSIFTQLDGRKLLEALDQEKNAKLRKVLMQPGEKGRRSH